MSVYRRNTTVDTNGMYILFCLMEIVEDKWQMKRSEDSPSSDLVGERPRHTCPT
jgi:hypothetical protein